MTGISDTTMKSLSGLQNKLQKAKKGGALHEISIDAITIVSNVRISIDEATEEFKEFIENIKQYGVLEPILVRPSRKKANTYELIAGERRLRASKQAKLLTIPAIVKHIEDDEVHMLQIIENIHRVNLTQFEEAQELKKSLEQFGSLFEVAKKWNKSKAWVSERLQLLDLQPSTSQLVADNVTADIAVINTVNRAEKINKQAGKELAERVRKAGDKRDEARKGLEEIKGKKTQLTSQSSEQVKESAAPIPSLTAAQLRVRLKHATTLSTELIEKTSNPSTKPSMVSKEKLTEFYSLLEQKPVLSHDQKIKMLYSFILPLISKDNNDKLKK